MGYFPYIFSVHSSDEYIQLRVLWMTWRTMLKTGNAIVEISKLKRSALCPDVIPRYLNTFLITLVSKNVV